MDWAVATSEVWVVADLAVVLEVEASEVVRRQCFNLLSMLVVYCSRTSVMKYPVCLTFIVHSCRSVFLFVSSKLVGPAAVLRHCTRKWFESVFVPVSRRYQRDVGSDDDEQL